MPFGPDCEYEDFDDCVAQNSGADDPEALCGQIQSDTEEDCAEGGSGLREWRGPIMLEGDVPDRVRESEGTGDGRMAERNSIVWDDGPWPVIWDRTDGDHTGPVVGQANRVWRDGDLIMAEGVLDTDSEDPETLAAVTRVVELLTPDEEGGRPAVGVSVMLDDEQIELRVRKELMEVEEDEDVLIAAAAPPAVTAPPVEPSHLDAAVAWLRNTLRAWGGTRPAAVVVREGQAAGHAQKTLRRAKEQLGVTSEKSGDGGKWVWKLPQSLLAAADDEDDGEDDDDRGDRIVVAKFRRDDMLEVLVHGRLRHIAILDTPAHSDARIALVASIGLDAFADPRFGADGDSDPRLQRQTPERPGEDVAWGAPLTVTDDGRVFGHAALWGRCHAGFANSCTVAPRGGGYERFLSAAAVPGVATGPIMLGTTHAIDTLSPAETMRHYSDSGRAVADVTVGEDVHGVWVAGVLRPGVPDRDVTALRGSSLSGDWRWIGGQYRLVGLLAVNNPGFLVERNVDQLALTAAVITAGPCGCDSGYQSGAVELRGGSVDGTGEEVLHVPLTRVAHDGAYELPEGVTARLYVASDDGLIVFEERAAEPEEDDEPADREALEEAYGRGAPAWLARFEDRFTDLEGLVGQLVADAVLRDDDGAV